ncbi:hypothetical protein GGH93_004753 [Coemansia aciculifera]|nr:hypothetical protein GGH93_004753 [Coemansia aciculifera]
MSKKEDSGIPEIRHHRMSQIRPIPLDAAGAPAGAPAAEEPGAAVEAWAVERDVAGASAAEAQDVAAEEPDVAVEGRGVAEVPAVGDRDVVVEEPLVAEDEEAGAAAAAVAWPVAWPEV